MPHARKKSRKSTRAHNNAPIEESSMKTNGHEKRNSETSTSSSGKTGSASASTARTAKTNISERLLLRLETSQPVSLQKSREFSKGSCGFGRKSGQTMQEEIKENSEFIGDVERQVKTFEGVRAEERSGRPARQQASSSTTPGKRGVQTTIIPGEYFEHCDFFGDPF